MKAEYCVEPTVDVYLDPASAIPDKMHIDGADIYFEISEDNLLKKVKVVYTGLPINLGGGGGPDRKGILINPNYPEIHNSAFKVLLFIFNYIHAQSRRSALDVAKLTNIEPTISPETQEEEEQWNNLPKSVSMTFNSVLECVGAVSFDNLKKHSEHAKAYANFADAQNAKNPITKYENLYKVIEHFFGVDSTGKEIRGENVDRSVSDFMIQHDSAFTLSSFGKLRRFRNRCMHPHQKSGHITSSDIDLMENLFDKTKQLERIAELLLKHK
jgi:hypothetical protein